MNKKLAWLCVAAVIVGAVTALWMHRESLIPALDMRPTDRIAEEIKENLETVTARLTSRDSQIKTEVRYVYEQTRTRINALPADDICAGLNRELALFRGLADGPGWMDGK
jgi:hypothetical protein